MFDARKDKELYDRITNERLDSRDINMYDCQTHRQWRWSHERECFYRSFFSNGDPVADIIYFKLLDYHSFWRGIWKSIISGI